MKKTTKLQIKKCLLQIGKLADSQNRKGANPQIRKSPVPPNTLITFPQYLKIPIRFWTSNVGHEIRSSFDLELYERVCESKGVSSGVQIQWWKIKS